MVKWVPTIIAVATAAVLAASPAVQAVWAAHPTVAGVVSSVFAVIVHLLPSPMVTK